MGGGETLGIIRFFEIMNEIHHRGRKELRDEG